MISILTKRMKTPDRRGMSFLEVLLSTFLFGILLVGVANVMSSLNNELAFSEAISRGIFLAREKMEVFMQQGSQADNSGSEIVQAGDGYVFRCQWELREDFPAPGLGLLTLEVCPVGGERGKILCKSIIARNTS